MAFAGAVLPIFSVLADVVLYRGAKSSNTEKDALKVVRTKITGTGEHFHKDCCTLLRVYPAIVTSYNIDDLNKAIQHAAACHTAAWLGVTQKARRLWSFAE